MRHFLSVLLFFLGFTQVKAFYQSKDTVMISKFTQKNGLSSYNIRKILQDKWGFIWLGTQEGLSRFDGNNFQNYSKNSLNDKKISGADVRDILEDSSQNIIWALSSEERGVDAINTINSKVERTIKIPKTSSEDYNLSMIKSQNELWVGSSTGVKILDCRKNSFVQNLTLPTRPNRSNDFTTQSMLLDEYKNVWVCYWGYGIVIYNYSDKSIIETIPLADLGIQKRAHEIRIFTGVKSRKGEVLFATNQGLRSIRYNSEYKVSVRNAPCHGMKALNSENIDWVIHDTDSTLLISGNHSLIRFDNSLSHFQTLEEFSQTHETNWLPSVLCMYKDRSEAIWLGCQEGLGYFKKNRSPFKPYTFDRSSNIKLDHVFAVSPLSDNKILVGLRNGLVEIDDAAGTFHHFDKYHLYQYVFTDSRGRVHVSRQEGLFIYEKGKLTPIQRIYREFTPYFSYSINSHLFIGDTLVILGTENNQGLLFWNPVKKTIRAINTKEGPSLISDIVNNIYRDNVGRVWVLSDNGITVLSADLLTSKKVELVENGKDIPYGLFFSICEINRHYYIASYGTGILELDEKFRVKRIFNTQNGLSNDGVYQVHAIPHNKILVTSNNGLSKIDLVSSRIDRYYQNDGLHSNAFEEASGRALNGKIYAGGVNGFTVIDPRYFSANISTPLLYFIGVDMKSDGSEMSFSDLHMKDLTVPSDIIQTIIRFVGLNYSNPERTGYAYRIVEESDNWIDNGNQASIALISHAPGKYTLEVKASNEEGIYSKPIKLQLYFQPKWYQTWWFKSLVFILIAIALYRFYRFRIDQLQHEHNIRKHLASDLHDDLGSTMNSINIYTNLAIMEYGTNRYLTNIKQGAQESITGIRDIIWILDDQKDTVEQLGERIFQFVNPLCEANHVSFVLKIEDNVKGHVFRKEEKRNLYMVIKEAINNSIKYAEPKHISLSVSVENKRLNVSVSDDGKGFDQDQPKHGNGLNNMKRRAGEIKYSFNITSSSTHGTVINLRKK